jgi:hypothetical protein
VRYCLKQRGLANPKGKKADLLKQLQKLKEEEKDTLSLRLKHNIGRTVSSVAVWSLGLNDDVMLQNVLPHLTAAQLCAFGETCKGKGRKLVYMRYSGLDRAGGSMFGYSVVIVYVFLFIFFFFFFFKRHMCFATTRSFGALSTRPSLALTVTQFQRKKSAKPRWGWRKISVKSQTPKSAFC